MKNVQGLMIDSKILESKKYQIGTNSKEDDRKRLTVFFQNSSDPLCVSHTVDFL